MKKIKYVITFIIIIILGLASYNYISKNREVVPLSIISSIPKNGSKYVYEKTEVIIELNREIKVDDGNKIRIDITPDIKTNTVYLGNKIRIKPEDQFQYGSEYNFKVFYEDNNIYTLIFSINPVTPEQLIEDSKKQMEGDIAYNEAIKRLIEDYPWYTSLPIETKDYRIVYDYEKEMFRIRLLKEFDQKEIDNFTKESILRLKEVGAEDPVKYYVLKAGEEY